MAVLSYTTTVAEDKTAMEIISLLRQWGATEISHTYDKEGNFLRGISFDIGGIHYRLICEFSGIHEKLLKDPVVPARFATIEHARKVAWRNLLGWLKYTKSIVETGLLQREQALMPYHVVANGQTLWEAYQERNLRLEAK